MTDTDTIRDAIDELHSGMVVRMQTENGTVRITAPTRRGLDVVNEFIVDKPDRKNAIYIDSLDLWSALSDHDFRVVESTEEVGQ